MFSKQLYTALCSWWICAPNLATLCWKMRGFEILSIPSSMIDQSLISENYFQPMINLCEKFGYMVALREKCKTSNCSHVHGLTEFWEKRLRPPNIIPDLVFVNFPAIWIIFILQWIYIPNLVTQCWKSQKCIMNRLFFSSENYFHLIVNLCAKFDSSDRCFIKNNQTPITIQATWMFY